MSEKKSKQLARLRDALDSEPIDDALAQEVVRDLGIDVKSFAAKLRSSISSWEVSERKARFEQAERKRQKRLALIERLPNEPIRPKAEQMALLNKYKPSELAGAQLNFMKFNEMTDVELARLVALARFDAEHPELSVDEEDTEGNDDGRNPREQ